MDNNTSLPNDIQSLREHVDLLELRLDSAMPGGYTRRYLLARAKFLRRELDSLPKPAPLPLHMQRDQLYREIMQLRRGFLVEFPETNLGDFIKDKYGVAEVNLMTVEQVRSLRDFMRAALRMETLKT